MEYAYIVKRNELHGIMVRVIKELKDGIYLTEKMNGEQIVIKQKYLEPVNFDDYE